MKASAIREMTSEELEQAMGDATKEMFNLRLQQTGGQCENPSRIKELRRDVARISTIKTERIKAEKS